MLTYEYKPVHGKFVEWLNDTIVTAASTMIEQLIVPLTPDQLYDAVVPAGQRELLRAASKLMPQMHSQPYQVKIANNLMYEYPTKEHTISATLVFRYSEPNYFLIPNVLNPLSEYTSLAEYLLPSFRIAREFSMLRYAVKELIAVTNNRDMLAALFPWLPDLVADSGWVPYKEPEGRHNEAAIKNNQQWLKFHVEQLGVKSITDRVVIDRSFAGAVKRGKSKPLMHTEVVQILSLGTKLFTQYRLLKSQDRGRKGPYFQTTYITPTLSDDLIPSSLIFALEETKKHYKYEQEQWLSKKQ